MSRYHSQETGNLYTDPLIRPHPPIPVDAKDGTHPQVPPKGGNGTHPPRAMSLSRPHPPVPLPQVEEEEQDSHYATIPPPPAKIR